ncbi:bacteriocin [Andreesenia angusta]|uniref:Bacteriocin n=1 Tax=Andreesenia angusta TaxID=39480 RepID=A0A1S1V7L0_9FIRM|nr:lactococcin 972 family bacteriocin [Andreesenia angusta]OHW62380.1 bacteriocin [Andreesenia angusta]
MKRLIKGTIMSLALTLGIGTAAFAAIAYVEGGVWDYGTTSTKVYSDYYHQSKEHTASVSAGGKIVRSGNVSKGQWAKASMSKSWYQTGYAYYNVK